MMRHLYRGVFLLSAVAITLVGVAYLGHLTSLILPAHEGREPLLTDGLVPAKAATQTVQAGTGDPHLAERVLQEQRQACQKMGSLAYTPGSACDQIRVPCGVRKAWVCPSLAFLPEEKRPEPIVIDWRSLVERPYAGPWVHPK